MPSGDPIPFEKWNKKRPGHPKRDRRKQRRRSSGR